MSNERNAERQVENLAQQALFAMKMARICIEEVGRDSDPFTRADSVRTTIASLIKKLDRLALELCEFC
jgi:hypothetical protein